MRYEYVRVKVDKNSKTMNAEMESHREIIDKKAAEGARYIGWFPTTQGPSGKIVEFDLVFEVA
ncbi:MAG: DUF4177 domain-containing protein [Actinomycetota bacterium]|jgi:hypothetical protein|nr:DUF4177 domain-containing protein [Actinomycetota bacterium]